MLISTYRWSLKSKDPAAQGVLVTTVITYRYQGHMKPGEKVVADIELIVERKAQPFIEMGLETEDKGWFHVTI